MDVHISTGKSVGVDCAMCWKSFEQKYERNSSVGNPLHADFCRSKLSRQLPPVTGASLKTELKILIEFFTFIDRLLFHMPDRSNSVGLIYCFCFFFFCCLLKDWTNIYDESDICVIDIIPPFTLIWKFHEHAAKLIQATQLRLFHETETYDIGWHTASGAAVALEITQ